MKIGEVKKQKNKNPMKTINQLIIGVLVFLLVFLSGALFQQRGLDNKLYGFFKDLRFTLINELNLVQKNDLQNLYLDIPYESLDKIFQKREEALAKGVLISSDEDFVPAQIRLDQGEELDVDIRLKGDWTDHLNTNKWSYRIHVKDGDMLLGTKRFSIQAPETRNYVAEWAFHQHCLYEGILTTKYTFLNVYENGVYKGIYAFEESFSEELLESQEQREGVILKFNEEFYWSNRAKFIENNEYWEAVSENFLDVSHSILSSEVDVFRESHLDDDPILKNQKEYAIALLDSYLNGSLPVNSVFNTKKIGKYYALLDLWAANHAAHWINMRFYFNPVSGLLEPIVYDAIPFLGKYNQNFLGYTFDEINLFDIPEVRSAYFTEMENLTQSENFNNYKDSVINDVENYIKVLSREYSSIEPIWNQIENRRKMISNYLNPHLPVRGSYYLSQIDGKITINIVVKNLTIFPVEIAEIQLGDKIVPFRDLALNNPENLIYIDGKVYLKFNKNVEDLTLPEIKFGIPVEPNEKVIPEDIFITVKINGENDIKEVPLSKVPSIFELGLQQPQIPLLEIDAILEKFSFLELDSNGDLIVPAGTWEIKEDLILPNDLNITLMPGAHLRFDDDSLLFLRGGNLNIFGSPDNYASISSINESWLGILIIDAKNESTWEYAEISNMRGFERKGWMVTGGITFYNSDISISNSIIKNSLSEDAINIIHSTFIFDNISISESVSDAFDGDFTVGLVNNSTFSQIKGDAIDVSGSTIEMVDCTFDLIGDKGISAGEHSEINARDVVISNANIGVASKDLSNVEIRDSEINHPNYVAFAAYQKKKIFGPGSIVGTNIVLSGHEKIGLSQIGSYINVNNEIIPCIDLDVKTLYDLGILGN